VSWLFCEARGVRIYEGKLCDRCGDRCYGGCELNLSRVTVHLCINCSGPIEDFILSGVKTPPMTREEEAELSYKRSSSRSPQVRMDIDARRRVAIEKKFKARFT